MSLGVAPSQPLFCQHRRLLAVTGCDPQRQWLGSFFDALIAHPALVKGTLSLLPILCFSLPVLLIVLACLIARFVFRWFVASRMLPAIPLVASRMLPVIPLVASRMHGQGGFSLSVRSLSRSSCRVSTALSIALALPSLCSLTLPESQPRPQPQFQHLAVLLLFMFDCTVQVPYCFEAAS